MANKKIKKRNLSYYVGRLEQAYKNETFSIDDKVKIAFSDPPIFGTIIGMSHENHGRGRVSARVIFEDGRVQNHPLGRLRKVKE